jgi:FkbM family methyltransferase
MWGEMMYQYFTRHGIEFYFIENDDAFYYKRNYMYEHISELYDCYVDFIDEYSRKSYLGVIREGMSGQLGEYIMAPEPQYMLDGFAPRLDDVAIDAGAFDGETARDFLWCGAKVYSFEMDEKNYKRCKELGDRIGFEVEAKGLWSKHEFVDYKENGAASSMLASGGDCQAEMTDLDSWAAAKNIDRIDFIKMDIEGVELEALQGGRRLISACKPRLAICAYHKWEHLYTLQQYIKSLRPDYEFAFRHYPLTSSILLPYQKEIFAHYKLNEIIPTWCECVLYAR